MDLPNASSNVVASSVAIRFGLRGPNLMLCNGATSGLDARLHVPHVSTAETVRLVRAAKARGARVTTTTHTYTASRVIIAVPPTLAARIAYDPPLPALSDGALQRTPAGGALKVHAVYPAPFWRDRGLSGMSTSDSGVLTETVDNTPPNSPRAVLTGFVYGDEAVLLRGRSLEERRRIVLERLGELFGDRALSPDDYVEFDWMAEEWTRGCFSGHLVPGSTVTFGPALRTPVEVVHWASTETATEWNGYFDGAVESGQRAAEEVRAALGK
jgi:monoamine oxidase